MRKWIPLWVVPAMIVLATGTVWLRLSIIRTTYSINETDRLIEKAQQNRDVLQLKVAALRSPRRLEVLARTRFKLSQPRMEQVVHLKKAEAGAHEP